ncbi:hypothetical protein QA639_12985 [Bradyrhizobium pachyrhizi]|uniref:hypothetical protein n=1 Tax=Bradyrhizobium TaxID=374 RepID=UPI0024B1D583|nr:hypothetical protein [Bradyrhizobium pachyrhizi]WFU58351.1 hypothetical protein QA639_12985 [Bradyrhizobium pachyrhizi]
MVVEVLVGGGPQYEIRCKGIESAIRFFLFNDQHRLVGWNQFQRATLRRFVCDIGDRITYFYGAGIRSI